MQVRMQRPLAILGHQDFHLTYREIFYVLILWKRVSLMSVSLPNPMG